jgi:hypothetical protein
VTAWNAVITLKGRIFMAKFFPAQAAWIPTGIVQYIDQHMKGARSSNERGTCSGSSLANQSHRFAIVPSSRPLALRDTSMTKRSDGRRNAASQPDESGPCESGDIARPHGDKLEDAVNAAAQSRDER